MYPFLKESFTNFLGKRNARDAVRSYSLSHAVRLEQDVPSIVYERVLISTGTIRAYQAVSQKLESNSLRLHWDPDTHQAFAQPDDTLSVVVYVPVLEAYLFFKACEVRESGEIILELPAECSQAGFHAWATFANATQVDYAFSTYLGRFKAL